MSSSIRKHLLQKHSKRINKGLSERNQADLLQSIIEIMKEEST